MPKKYGTEDLAQAINNITNGTLSVYRAAKMYNVPKTTLLDKLKEKYKNDKAGRPTILTKEEEELITKWILVMAEIGFPVTKQNLVQSVNKLVAELNRPNTFKNGLPGKHWYEGFITRNPTIAQRVSQTLVHARVNVDETKIRAWFERVHDYFVTNNLLDVLDDPSRIFNADESAFFLCPKGDAVLARKGAKTVYSRAGNDEKECLTVLVGASANGQMMPPLALFPFKRLPRSILDKYPKNWIIGKTDSGWMTAAAFFEYMANAFNPFLQKEQIKKPVVLFMDGHVSNLSLQVCEFAQKNEIILIALLPHATHILQPMDVAVFRSLKGSWAKGVRNWRIQNNGARLKKEDFAPILNKAMEGALNSTLITNGFRKCGLYPFNANAIDYGSFLKNACTSAVSLPITPPSSPQSSVPTDEKNIVKIIENRLGNEKLKCFKESGGVWRGDVRDENLYYFWKSFSEEITSTSFAFGNSTLEANICLDEYLSFDIDNILISEEDHQLANEQIQDALEDLLTLSPEKSAENHEVPKRVQELVALTPQKTAEQDERENKLQTPPAQTPQNNKKDEFPTPFKNALMFVEGPSLPNPTLKKKVSKRVTPTVASSVEYINHLKVQDKEKQNKMDELDKRRKIREKKKTDALAKQNKKATTNKTTIFQGDYVAFLFEGEKYPGMVLEIKNKDQKYKIKAMHMSLVKRGQIYWRWPDQDDVLEYDAKDILRKIKCPTPVNNVGDFKVEIL